ncbi:MAG: NADPH:quinone oxidoreductase family protein [Actinomycetia bacterium]|nr:NADPH:quinone oxidoreductase family protein [Actinomycetes bacterium]
MRALQVVELTGPQSVQLAEIADPVPGAGDVLIDVKAAGVTFPDVLLTRGQYQIRPEPPFIPGCEVAGVVVSAPPDSGFAPGDRVAAFPGLGGFAERVSVTATHVFALPDGVSFEVGAALPMNAFTVQFALETRGRMKPGDTLLVHGAAGGIGTAAIQFAKAKGATVIGVVSTPEKAQVALAAGADHTVTADSFKDEAKALTGDRGVDIVLDPVGGDRFTDSIRSLATYGRVLVVGFTGGEIPTVKVNRLLLGNTEVIGAGWGAVAFTQPDYMKQQWAQLLPLIQSGQLDPIIGSKYPLADGITGIEELQDRRATGKVLLVP